MYATFNAFAPTPEEDRLEHNSPPNSRPESHSRRPKRSQVQRACRSCRLNRIRCDAGRPCRNCKDHKRQCVDAQVEIRSLATATEEIARLRRRLKELEDKYEKSEKSEKSIQFGPSSSHRPLPARYEWAGIRIDDLYYGPSSLAYFSNRMHIFFQPFFPPAPLDFDTLRSLPPAVTAGHHPTSHIIANASTRSQDEQGSYLRLYWLWFHPFYPIVIEDLFHEHYESLWTPSNPIRAPSALVDIMLALCMQFSASYTFPTDASQTLARMHPHPFDAGYAHFLSCQTLLENKQDVPTLMHVQAYILSAVYLINYGSLNHAQVVVAKGIRTATVLGYDREVAMGSQTNRQRELPRRLWWTLYLLDSQLVIETGRPFLIDPSTVRCRRPSDSPVVARAMGKFSVDNPDVAGAGTIVSWLTYHNQLLDLTHIFRRAYEAFFEKCSRVLTELNSELAMGGDGKLEPLEVYRDLYGHADAREKCAQFLMEAMKNVHSWAEQVPPLLRLRRLSGSSFSVSRSPYVLEQTTAVWLQTQRIQLELMYHHYCAILYRGFICFYTHPAFGTPFSDNCATLALNHAIVSTMLLHQTYTETDLLVGCHRILYLQKSAVRTILGFSCAYPVCPSAPAARKMASLALRTYEELWPNKDDAVLQEEIRSVREHIEISEKALARFTTQLRSVAPGFEPPLLPSPSAVSDAHLSAAQADVHVQARTPDTRLATPAVVTTSMASTISTATAAATDGADKQFNLLEPESLWVNLEAASVPESWEWTLTDSGVLENTVGN